MISIIDYDMGNLRSVQKAFQFLGTEAEVVRHPEDIESAERLVLPGVGAFRDAINALQERNLVDAIKNYVDSGRPMLGICLGLQLFFDQSYEDGEFEGLGILAGDVVRFEDQPNLKIPHMGWNELIIERDSPLLKGIEPGDHTYFVHSYHAVPKDDSIVVATTEHGEKVVAVVQHENVYATQFHPEKSQAVGQTILKNFSIL